jgi:hypothetical protein
MKAKYRAAGHLHKLFSNYSLELQRRAMKRWDKNYYRDLLIPVAKRLEYIGYGMIKSFLNRLRIRILEIKVASNNSMWKWKVANIERRLHTILRVRTLKNFSVFKLIEAVGWIEFNNQRAFLVHLQRIQNRYFADKQKELDLKNSEIKAAMSGLQERISKAKKSKKAMDKTNLTMKVMKFGGMMKKFVDRSKSRAFNTIKSF